MAGHNKSAAVSHLATLYYLLSLFFEGDKTCSVRLKCLVDAQWQVVHFWLKVAALR